MKNLTVLLRKLIAQQGLNNTLRDLAVAQSFMLDTLSTEQDIYNSFAGVAPIVMALRKMKRSNTLDPQILGATLVVLIREDGESPEDVPFVPTPTELQEIATMITAGDIAVAGNSNTFVGV